MRKPTERELAAIRVNPNPRIVALLDYVLDEIMERLHRKDEYAEWLEWAASWRRGERSPERCVKVGRLYLAKRESPINHTLGQLAWAGKEACYDIPQSGWLVIRYIADAMVTFGVAFPKENVHFLEPPSFDAKAIQVSGVIEAQP